MITMTPLKKTLIGFYFAAMFVVVVYVPWTAKFEGNTISQGYHLIFIPPQVGVIDFGRVLLELVAVTCIAGVVWLFKDRL